MHPNRETVGFITVLVMVCCLALGGFPSLAAAKTIVVTTLDDIANPPFDADVNAASPCGVGTIKDLPGADGQVSLREAIIAANNTSGADTITFDPSLSEGTIMVNFDDRDADSTSDPLPALCGGHITLNGDLDGDDVPDITLEGAAFPIPLPPAVAAVVAAAGISVLSSHNTINGLHVQHFPFGIRVLAGNLTTPGTITHTTVENNILADSKINGILVATGNAPDSRITHTTLTQNLVMHNARNGIFVTASLFIDGQSAGSDAQITHTTITDNEIMENGQLGVAGVGILLLSAGDRNIVSHAIITRNTVSDNIFFGINVNGGFGGADENSLDLRINDNTVTDNGVAGIRVISGQDHSSDNRVEARIQGNTVERNSVAGIATVAGQGAISLNFPISTSNNNVLDVRIEQNTVRSQPGAGILVAGGVGSPNGRAGAVADNNQTHALVMHNVVEGNTGRGMQLDGGGPGLANDNTLEVRVAHNTVCNNVPTDIRGEGGFTGSPPDFSPNLGTENVLTGEIFQNTVTTVTVQGGEPGNTANVTQFNNDPCP